MSVKKSYLDKYRLPYNPEEYRTPLYGESTDQPEGYKSIQQTINSGPKGTVDENKLDKYIDILKKKGFGETTVKDLKNQKPGVRVCYVTINNKWRSGGFLVSVSISENINEETKLRDKLYFAYKSFNGAIFHVQEDDVKYIWVKASKKKKEPGIVYVKRHVGETTNFPLVITDLCGKEVIFGYAKDGYNRDRFYQTEKYMRMLEHGWVYED